MTAGEILPVVDACDRVTGSARRDVIHARGLRHRAVHVLVLDARGRLFVQKRAAGKDTFAGRYDSSASGHVDRGESYRACALRELREELGLRVPAGRLRRLFKIAACRQTGWEFVWVYAVRSAAQPVINPAEIESGKFWLPAEIRKRMAQRAREFAPSFRRVFVEFQRRCKAKGFRL
jgi:isopentenyldiphosphate isomerase